MNRSACPFPVRPLFPDLPTWHYPNIPAVDLRVSQDKVHDVYGEMNLLIQGSNIDDELVQFQGGDVYALQMLR